VGWAGGVGRVRLMGKLVVQCCEEPLELVEVVDDEGVDHPVERVPALDCEGLGLIPRVSLLLGVLVGYVSA